MNKRDEHMGVDRADMFLCNCVCNVVGRFTVISLFYLTVLELSGQCDPNMHACVHVLGVGVSVLFFTKKMSQAYRLSG